MRFVNHIVGKRTGLLPDAYSSVWTAEEVKQNLAPSTADRKPSTYAEILSQGSEGGATICKLYLDHDFYCQGPVPTAEEVQRESEAVIRNVRVLLEGLGTDKNNLTCVIATRHGLCPKKGLWKLSHRPFLQGFRIRYTDIPKVLKVFGQEGFWDPTVYKSSEQLLAVVNCCKGVIGKYYDGRVLQPQSDCLDPLCYVAQYVEEAWGLLDLPADFGAESKANEITTTAPQQVIDHGDDTNVCPLFVAALTACLSTDSSNDRESL